MPDLPAAQKLLPLAPAATHDVVVLGYDERLVRRRRLVTRCGDGFLVDLPNVTNLDDYWGFQLMDGRCIQVLPAEEPLLQITGDLPRLCWHIGNRHTPCQIEPFRLLIRRDHVLEAMLRQLGATIDLITEPFTPEGGAYGTGRTMGHDHGGHDPGGHTPTEPTPETFGWHDHGDGHLHFHAPKR
jgi:urease accessory protein